MPAELLLRMTECRAERYGLLKPDSQIRKSPVSTLTGLFDSFAWWAVRDSNPRQSVCKTDTLPTELTARCRFF